ncbi:MAG: hypothetical protein ACE5DM_02240 [Candidatus Nanoarchaeia archaeon]
MGIIKKIEKKARVLKPGKVKHIFHKAMYEAVEAMFPLVDNLLEAELQVLTWSSNKALFEPTNEGDDLRKYIIETLNKKVIPNLNLAIVTAKMQFSFGSNTRISNTLGNTSAELLRKVENLLDACKKNNLQQYGWTTPYRMFSEFKKIAINHAKRIEEAFGKGSVPEIAGDVLDDLRHIYLNRFEDDIGRLNILAASGSR